MHPFHFQSLFITPVQTHQLSKMQLGFSSILQFLVFRPSTTAMEIKYSSPLGLMEEHDFRALSIFWEYVFGLLGSVLYGLFNLNYQSSSHEYVMCFVIHNPKSTMYLWCAYAFNLWRSEPFLFVVKRNEFLRCALEINV